MSTIKFYPLQSAVEPGFWHSLAKSKLEEFKLNEESRKIYGTFTITSASNSAPAAFLNISWDALNTEHKSEDAWNHARISGEMLLLNTIESFKQIDKSKWIQDQGAKIWSKFENGDFTSDPSVLTNFSVILFGDLKKFQFYYWFNFPSFSVRSDLQLLSCDLISAIVSEEMIDLLSTEAVKFRKNNQHIYAVVLLKDSRWQFYPLSEVNNLSDKLEDGHYFLAHFDACTAGEYPGWSLRNLVLAMSSYKPDILNKVQILCLRVVIKEGKYKLGSSLVLKVKCDGKITNTMPNVVGWEKNDKGQLGPRFVNMRSSMDPVKIAESSVDLNLKLMKWRLVPDLNLDCVAASKFLLLGSGTLGCGVARCLLGWGARNVTFVDNAKVSYSNPVRQSLFEFSDCIDGGKKKSKAAADKLKQIFPGVSSEGIDLTIPMPGHPISKQLESEAKGSFDTLKALIDDSDVIFLLMDSRESRWLPTVMTASCPDKILINAALGFDTFLVMRHGIRPEGRESSPVNMSCGLISGEDLGCYYCNDVVAPGDSLSDRTLDMQCTVTRPGVSAVAAALAVELAVSCLQHKDKGGAAALMPAGAVKNDDPTENESSEGILGVIPHSIRGSIHTYTQYLPATPAFPQCTACSKSVIQAYKTDGFELMRKVAENPKFLEDLTGLTNLLTDAQLMEGVIDLEDDEFSVSDM